MKVPRKVMRIVMRKVTRTIAIMMTQVVRSDGDEGEEFITTDGAATAAKGADTPREEGAATAAKQRWMLAAAPHDTSHHAR